MQCEVECHKYLKNKACNEAEKANISITEAESKAECR